MTNQPLNILVDDSLGIETKARWSQAGHTIIELSTAELPRYDIIVSERAWRANDESLKSTEAMMFRAARAEKRVRDPKPTKARKPRKARMETL